MRCAFAVIAALLAGCNEPPPSWDRLLAGRITAQYPAYSVSGGPDVLTVSRPTGPATVEVQPIARFCQRGPRDCDYAIDQMLLGLAPGKP